MKKLRTMTLELLWPIEVEGGEDITSLTLSRPKGRDMMAMAAVKDNPDVDPTVLMMAKMTGLSEEQINEMDGEDFTRVMELIADFFPQSASPLATSDNGGPSSLTAPPSSTPR